MSEETRRARQALIDSIEQETELLRGEISTLEDRIEEMQRRVPRELPEDREWRLAQLDPVQRKLIEIAEKLFHDSVIRQFEEKLNFLEDVTFIDGTQWKVNPKLKINYPNNFTITTPKRELP